MAGSVLSKNNIFGGAARIIIAEEATVKPTKFSDVFDMTGSHPYDLQTGWIDVGATDGGLSVTRGYDKEEWTVDQVLGPIDEFVTQWNMTLSTSLAESSLTNLNYAWITGSETASTTVDPDEVVVGISATDDIPERMLGFQVDKRKTGTGLTEYMYMRLYVFWRAKYDGSDVEHAYRKGEKTLLPISFKLFADTEEAVSQQFGVVIDQTYGTFTG